MTDYIQSADVLKRVRFFDGQFLQDQDFVDEQKYHLDRERRLGRSLGFTGVVSGLVVTALAAKPFRVVVSAGTAVDASGRFLVLPADVTLDLPAQGFAKKQGVGIYAVYREQATDIAQTGTKSARRWEETPIVAAVAQDGTVAVTPGDAPATWDSPGILLGRIGLSDKGDISVDQTPIPPAGLNPPGPFRGQLTVAGNVGVGTGTPENSTGWNRVLDVVGGQHSRLLVRTTAGKILGGVMAHDLAAYGANSSMLVGTESGHNLSLLTSSAARLTVAADGNVGIGTTGPGAKLEIAGNDDISVDLVLRGRIRSNSKNGGLWVSNDRFVGGYDTSIGFFSGNNWALSVTSEGNVGIGTGTTAPFNDGGFWQRVVEVKAPNAGRLILTTSSTNATTNQTPMRGLLGAHDSSPYGFPKGHLVVGTETAHGLGFITNYLPRMVLDVNGQLAIGATAVDNKGGWQRVVDVVGDLHARLLVRTTNTAKVFGGLMAHEGAAFGLSSGNLILGNESAHGVGVITSAAVRLTVTKDGDVGIGTTTPSVDAANWQRTVEVTNPRAARVLVSTTKVKAALQAHDVTPYGMPTESMVVGTYNAAPVAFMNNSAVSMVLDAKGNLGLGIMAPAAKLHVNGPNGTSVDSLFSGRLRCASNDGGMWVTDNRFFGGFGTNQMGFWTTGVGWNALTVSQAGNVTIGSTVEETKLMVVADSNHLLLRRVSGSMKDGRMVFLELRQDEIAGYGAQPSIRFHQVNKFWHRLEADVNGFHFKTGNTVDDAYVKISCSAVAQFSDERLKEGISPLEDALNTVQRLRGVSFKWINAAPGRIDHPANAAAPRGGSPGREIGLIAQEVETVLPEVVHTGTDGMKSLDYSKLTALLIEAVKEQQSSIAELRQQLHERP